MARNNPLKRRVTRAIVEHAVFRLESALTIALTIILIFLVPEPFPWWQWWYWLILGLAGEALVIYTSVTDETTARQVTADLLRQEFNPSDIGGAPYRQRVERALDYRRRIEEHVSSTQKGILRDHLLQTTAGIGDWVASVFGLAKRLDRYYGDEVLARDRRRVPREIAELRSRLPHEDTDSVRLQLQQAIASKEEQLVNLQKLQDTMERAEYQLETTLTALGTVYSQIQLIGAQDIGSGRARRLRQDIAEQVESLQALQEALDEVYETSRVEPILQAR
jgi:hypothetical protein